MGDRFHIFDITYDICEHSCISLEHLKWILIVPLNISVEVPMGNANVPFDQGTN